MKKKLLLMMSTMVACACVLTGCGPKEAEIVEESTSAVEEVVVENPFYMPVEDVFEVTGIGTCVTGTVERGTVKTGDEVWLIGMGEEIIQTTVASNGTNEEAEKVVGNEGESVGIYLTGVEKEQIQRGMVLIMPNTMWAYTEFTAEITMLPDDNYDEEEILVNGEAADCYIYVTQAEGTVQLQDGVTGVAPGETAVVTVKLSVPMAMETGIEIAIRQGGRTIATGVITEIAGVENDYNYVQAEVTSESKEETAVSSEQASQSESGTTFYEDRYGFRYAFEDVESGFIYGIAEDEIVLVRYEGEATDVVIPSMIADKKVTTIAESCFYKMPVTSVVCPETLKVIDKSAFDGCTELKEVTFNEGLERIEDCAFGGTGLEKVILPDTVNYVGDLAFCCDNCIKEIKFSASMTELGNSFACCGATDITVPGNIKVVGYESFSECNNLKTLVFEEGVEILEEDFILYCDALESIVIPSTVTQIGDISIYDLDNLVFTVTAGSYAEQYMIENKYAYITK